MPGSDVVAASWPRNLLQRLVPVDVPCAVRVLGRTIAFGDAPPAFTIVAHSPTALATLLLRPTMLAIGEAFIEGAFDVEGDLPSAVAAAYRIAAHRPASGSSPGRRWHRLRRAAPAAREVAAHYDLSNEFYALFLDRRMQYTCAYYPRADATLEEAQEAKLDLVCRKLALSPGERFLDVGCGWGGLVAWATAHHGVRATGVTLSAAQASWARAMLSEAGHANATIEQRDVYDLRPARPFDKAAAIGVIEHMGVARYATYFARVRELLRPGGLFLGQGITHQTTSPRTSGMAFLDRYVFPGGDLATIDHTLAAMAERGLQVVHVEAIGAHYVPTLREWLARLEARRGEASALVGERTYRIYVAYLAAAAVAFEAGWVDVHQILARRP